MDGRTVGMKELVLESIRMYFDPLVRTSGWLRKRIGPKIFDLTVVFIIMCVTVIAMIENTIDEIWYGDKGK
jgi:hypothetical protein